jgi:hypothetical protein
MKRTAMHCIASHSSQEVALTQIASNDDHHRQCILHQTQWCIDVSVDADRQLTALIASHDTTN